MRQPPLNWVLERIIVAEKSNRLREEENTYVFRVNPKASRETIRDAVESIYEVKVAQVRTLRQNGKEKRRGRIKGRTSEWKKAYVRLNQGETIDILEQA